MHLQVRVGQGDHARIVLDDVLGRKGDGHRLLHKELLHVGVAHDAVEQVRGGLAGAGAGVHLLEVILGDDHRDRDNKLVVRRAAQLAGVNFLAHQHVNRNAQTGRRHARRVGHGNGVKGGILLEARVPQLQELAAGFADAHRPLGRVGGQHGLHGANGHAVLRPVGVHGWEGGQEVGHDLLPGGFVPLAGVFAQQLDVGVVLHHIVDGAHAQHVRRVAREAFDLDNVARAVELLGQPIRGGLGPQILVNTYVVNALGGQRLVDRDDDDALGDGVFQGGIQAIDVTRVHQDGVDLLVDQVLQLLYLARHVGVGALDDQVVGDARCHIFSVDVLELLDHLRAIFAADEGVRDTDGELLAAGRGGGCGRGGGLSWRDGRDSGRRHRGRGRGGRRGRPSASGQEGKHDGRGQNRQKWLMTLLHGFFSYSGEPSQTSNDKQSADRPRSIGMPPLPVLAGKARVGRARPGSGQSAAFDLACTTNKYSRASWMAPVTPASGPIGEKLTTRSRVASAVDRCSTARRMDDSSWLPIFDTPPPMRIMPGLKKLTRLASTSPISRPLVWTISIAARSPSLAAAPTSSARSNPALASSRRASTALCPSRAAASARAAMAGPAASSSRQPMFPQRHIGPLRSAQMWPMSPAPPLLPRWMAPLQTMPAPMPVPILTKIRLSTPTAAPARSSPSAMILTSLSTITRAVRKVSRKYSPIGKPSQAGISGGATRVPVENSTGPGTPMPIPNTR